jgi:hypothetical protein
MLTPILRKIAEGADMAATWYDGLDPNMQYLVVLALAYGVMFAAREVGRMRAGKSYRLGLEDGKRVQRLDAEKAFEEFMRKREAGESGETGSGTEEE